MPAVPQEDPTCFVTVITAQRRRLFELASNAELLQSTLFEYRSQGKFRLHAYAILPDSLQLLLTPTEELPVERAVQLIKVASSVRLQTGSTAWMRGFNKVVVTRPDRCAACIRFIEESPLSRALAREPELYPFSSASRKDLDELPPHLQA